MPAQGLRSLTPRRRRFPAGENRSVRNSRRPAAGGRRKRRRPLGQPETCRRRQATTIVHSAALLRQSAGGRAEGARAHSSSIPLPAMPTLSQSTGLARALPLLRQGFGGQAIDALRQGARVTDPLDGLATLIPIRLSSLSAGPDVTRVGVVFTGTNAVPVSSKSIGRDRAQFRVRKSTGSGRRGLRHVPAVPAGNPTRHARAERQGGVGRGMPVMIADPLLDEGRQG